MRMKISNIFLIVAASVTLPSVFSCVKEDFGAEHVEAGHPVEAVLAFEAPAGQQVTVTTKAELDDYNEITSLYLFVYNSDGTYCEDVIPVENETDIVKKDLVPGTGQRYEAKIRTTTGQKRIFAVANYTSVQSWVNFRSKIEELGKEAESGNLTIEDLGKEIVYLRNTYITNGTTPEYPTQQMIFTSTADGDQVTFSLDGSSSGVVNLQRIVANVIFNIRNGSVSGKRIAFTPTSYRLYNIARGTRLAGERNHEENPVESDPSFYYDGSEQTVTTTATGGVYSFDVFIPENIQSEVSGVTSYGQRDQWIYNSEDGSHTGDPDSPAGTGVGSSNGEKKWTYAPENATYIVISGDYAEYDVTGSSEMLKYSGSTSYVIHLGDFSSAGSFGDFSVNRNWKYTYTITVNGVDSIISEAQTDNGSQGAEPGAEGGIINTNEVTLSFSLDAHYEQVLLAYNLSNILSAVSQQGVASGTADSDGNGIPDVDEIIADNLILHVDTPFQDGTKTKIPYLDYLSAADKASAKAAFLKDVDYKWVEFYPQASSTDLSAYPGLPLWKNGGMDINPGSTGNERLLDVYDVCVKLGQAVRALYDGDVDDEDFNFSWNSDSDTYSYNGIDITCVRTRTGGSIFNPTYSYTYYAYFTGFVDEYYYKEYPVTAGGHTEGESVSSWSDFTNKPERRMMISMDIQVSPDGNSTYSRAHTSISQKSIQTFYDGAQRITAFGMETYNETPAMAFGQNHGSGYSDTDGRRNTLQLIGIEYYSAQLSYYINASDNGHKSSVSGVRKLTGAYVWQYAYAACLSRNRDIDGDGYISDEELKWYLPSINEYIRIGMGANAVSGEASLYVGDKSLLTKDGYPQDFIMNGALYHTSTNTNSKSTFWAVEKGSYGGQRDAQYNNGRFMIRCIRHLPSDVANEDLSEIPEPIYERKTTSNDNWLLDFRGRLTSSLFRQIPNPWPYNFVCHDEDDEYNRFYDAMVLSKDYMVGEWSTAYNDIANTLLELQNSDNNRDNPCADYHETGEPENAGWRLPNLAELTVLASDYDTFIKTGRNSANNHTVPACTQFSNQNVRQAFYLNTNKMITCGDDYDGRKSFYIRCVRDATDEELASSTTGR